MKRAFVLQRSPISFIFFSGYCLDSPTLDSLAKAKSMKIY